MKSVFSILALFFTTVIFAQNISYSIGFENAVHHEASIDISYKNLKGNSLLVQMSRTSPGRYAIHDFAKNVYNVKAFNSKGEVLEIKRLSPQAWEVLNHDKTVHISYTLFANRADGTYSQVDETHAHLNIPATFMYAPSLSDNPIEITFKPRTDLNWKVATQLPLKIGTTYTAPNLQYFMDSPTEISNYSKRSFKVKNQDIEFVLHHKGSEEDLDTYFEKVKKVVLAEEAVYGELPSFDYGKYTFLACYIGNVSGDGMEHRNSTILTDKEGLAEGGMKGNIGTVSHEFFHAWNVERIRPQSLEPFNFEEANMSGELWFAEGFTSYYTNLILCRAGVITPEDYVNGLNGTFNYVWNSPARQFFNPIEMSYQAPFVDAASSIDPVNRDNTFISYYSYGSVLGLALDLSLREKYLNLDDYMKMVWSTYGKTETPYTIQNLNDLLNAYAGEDFGNNFFNNYIYKSNMPDYNALFKTVGLKIEQDSKSNFSGLSLNNNIVSRSAKIGSPAYLSGLEKGDELVSVNGLKIAETNTVESIINTSEKKTITIEFIRNKETKTTTLTLVANPRYTISISEDKNKELLKNRDSWLKQ
ncbi:M61 family metallopeptidase [uncultured Lacinutrix sp.]|uniref:M61 family metallopeptidase n=1 Tax=uncultured Lacinutrix sp. TaxID=574032 RepID=UPI002630DBA3|nr:PDZ domain-containing protein [uncultured Lacinutrix sp.]